MAVSHYRQSSLRPVIEDDDFEPTGQGSSFFNYLCWSGVGWGLLKLLLDGVGWGLLNLLLDGDTLTVVLQTSLSGLSRSLISHAWLLEIHPHNLR